MSSRNTFMDASRRLFASGAIPRYSNPNIIVDPSDDAGYAVGRSITDSPLPAIPLFSGWARYRRDNLHWSELEKWVETRQDVVRARRAGTNRVFSGFVRQSIGKYQVPDSLYTDRMFVQSEPEAVALLVVQTIMTSSSPVMDLAGSIFDICMRRPQRNYREPTEGQQEHNDRARDRLFWLCVLKLRRVICWRDVEVLSRTRAGVDWSLANVAIWGRDGMHLSIDEFPRPPNMLLVGQTCPPRGLSIPEPVSLTHFAHLYHRYRGQRESNSERANRLEEIMQIERSVLLLLAVMSERSNNKWLPVLSVGVIEDMCRFIPSARIVLRVGPEGLSARDIITECTRARLAPEEVVVKSKRPLCEEDVLFVPLDRLPQIALGAGTFRSAMTNARLAGTSVGVPLRSRPAPTPRERPVSVPASAALPSFGAVRAEAQALRSRQPSASTTTREQPRTRASPAATTRRSTPTRPASVPSTPTAPMQMSTPTGQPSRPSSSRDRGSSSTPAQPTATSTPPTTNPSRTQPTTEAQPGSSSEITSVTDLGRLKVRFDDLYHSFPFFRDLLRPLHTPNKTTLRVRELLERFNGHMRSQDPRAPRQHRGGRNSMSNAQAVERAREAEAEAARLRARIDAMQRDRIAELEGRGPERRGTSRGREEEDDGRRPTSRRRRDDRDDRYDRRDRDDRDRR